VSTIDHRLKKPRDHVRAAIRLKHYSIRAEESSVTCIKEYTLFHNTSPPNELASAAIEGFLSHLGVQQKVVASIQY
jgi:hypothetical protein